MPGQGKIAAMRIGIVSDIHCNASGLLAAIDAMGDIDELICAGDSIHEYRFSNEVVAILRERQAHTILGNHEEGFFGTWGERARAQPWIQSQHLQWLAERPFALDLEFADRRIALIHSTPWKPRGQYIFGHMKELERFAETDADFVIYGHTHAPLVRRFGDTTIVNPGSAGQARDGHGLSCAVIDLVSGEAKILSYASGQHDLHIPVAV